MRDVENESCELNGSTQGCLTLAEWREVRKQKTVGLCLDPLKWKALTANCCKKVCLSVNVTKMTIND